MSGQTAGAWVQPVLSAGAKAQAASPGKPAGGPQTNSGGAPAGRVGAEPPSGVANHLQVRPVPFTIARDILTCHHYLRSAAGGTKLAFGTFLGSRLLGALTFGAGPANVHRLVKGATPADCLVLTRLWLDDELPRNSESRVIGLALRAFRRVTKVRFLISYADPTQGHLGVIYQATNWLYTGLSEAMPLYNLGDGVARHSRSLSHAFGSHSVTHFQRHGIAVTLVPQAAKHRYLYFLDPTWRSRLRVPVLPYPKKAVYADR